VKRPGSARASRRVAVAPRPARERVLDAAAELFYRDGVRATGVDAVIARAGVAKRSFYRHYPSKDLLVVAWLQRTSRDWLAWMRAGLARRRGGPRERLLAVFDLLDEWMGQPGFRGCPFQNSASELADLAHPARAEVRRHKAAVRALLVELASALPDADAGELADELALLVDGAIVAAVARGGRPAHEARRAAARLLPEA